MRFDIITIFPNLFNSFLEESLMKKSLDKKLNKIVVHDLRRWASGKHEQVDDRPYGGGAGMVLMAQPIIKAVSEIKHKNSRYKPKVIMLCPSGKQLDTSKVKKLAKEKNIILLCGRYEGFDARIGSLIDEKISIGPYILSGGELPAMVLVESISRFIPGFLSNPDSLKQETSIRLGKKICQHPQYTRPEILKIKGKEYLVPKVLLSGNHAEIHKWRKNNQRKSKNC